MPSKVCSLCKTMKPFSDFPAAKKNTTGVSSWCLICTREYSRKRAREHYDSAKSREACRRWREKNPDKVRAQNIRWPKENPERRKASTAEWRKNNRERVRTNAREWYRNNPERYRKYIEKVKSTPKGKLKVLLGSAIYNSLKSGKGGRQWESLVGYTSSVLKAHLEKQFTNGMSWDNYGPYWHIDHNIPIDAFNFENPEDIDFRRCWALSNLRPLLAVENLKKHTKLTRPHQPSLLLQEVA